jgi:hypothetical protein
MEKPFFITFTACVTKCKRLTSQMREEHRLRVFENRVLKGIFGPKRDEVTGGWRKLHNEELHGLYSSPNVIKMTCVALSCVGRDLDSG